MMLPLLKFTWLGMYYLVYFSNTIIFKVEGGGFAISVVDAVNRQ